MVRNKVTETFNRPQPQKQMTKEQITDEFNSTRKSTKYCIVDGCCEIAKAWTGHLLKLDGYVLSGFCDKHRSPFYSCSFDKQGCFGTLTETELKTKSK